MPVDHKTKYLLSLPERVIRSLASVATGITTMGTKLLLPKAVRKSATYRVTFGMLQKFLMTSVAQVDMEAGEDEIELKDQYVKRKAVGSFIEGMGMLSFHFSPVWLLAIVSDLSGGSKVYLNHLVKDFKDHGILSDQADVTNVSDLLDGISKSTQLGMDTLDTPPISQADFMALKADSAKHIQANKDQLLAIGKDLEGIWSQMLEASRNKDMDLRQLNGSMTIHLMKSAGAKGIDLTKVSSKATGQFFKDHVIASYQESLDDLNREGKRAYVKRHMAPFLEAIPKHFKYDKDTTTSWLLDKRTGDS